MSYGRLALNHCVFTFFPNFYIFLFFFGRRINVKRKIFQRIYKTFTINYERKKKKKKKNEKVLSYIFEWTRHINATFNRMLRSMDFHFDFVVFLFYLYFSFCCCCCICSIWPLFGKQWNEFTFLFIYIFEIIYFCLCCWLMMKKKNRIEKM